MQRTQSARRARRLEYFLLVLLSTMATSWVTIADAAGRPRPDAGRLLLEFRLAMVARDPSFASPEVQSYHDAKFKNAAALTWGIDAAQFPFRAPDIGALGFGFGFHVHHHESVSTSRGQEEAKTIFQMIPMQGFIIAQLDGPAHCCSAVLVPYAKLGVAAAPWKLRHVENKTVGTKEKYVNTTIGSGAAYGVGQAIGLRLMLDGATLSDRDSLGVRHTFVFLEHARMQLKQSDDSRLDLTWWTGGVAAQW